MLNAFVPSIVVPLVIILSEQLNADEGVSRRLSVYRERGLNSYDLKE
jgi:hypothetical protein